MSQADIKKYAQLLWDYHHMGHTLQQSDVILVLGTNDLRVAEHAARLFHENWAPLLIFSGGIGPRTVRHWNTTEAEAFAQVAVSHGVPRERMLLETASTNTGENIQFTRELLQQKGIVVQQLIVVQKPFMERRCFASVVKQWPGVECITSSPPLSLDEFVTNTLTWQHTINDMVGNLQRIEEYPARGYQIPQQIPQNVYTAYKSLVNFGFTGQHLVA